MCHYGFCLGAALVACCEAVLVYSGQIWKSILTNEFLYQQNTTVLLLQLKKYVLSTLVLFLAHCLMCWPDTSDDNFKLVDKILFDLFQS